MIVIILKIVIAVSFLYSADNTSISNSTVSARTALETIVKYLKSDNSDIKSYAIEALSKTNETKLIPLLKKYLDDKNRYVVIAAAKALWNLGDNSGIKKLYEIAENIDDIDITKNDPLTQLKIISTNKIREKAISTIAEIEGIKSRNLLIKIKENDLFGQMRDAATRELARIGYRNEIETFYNALKSEDEEIRNQAAENLSKICPEDGSKIIDALKKEKSLRIKLILLDSLKCSRLSSKEEDDILKFITDENQTLKIKAITVLTNSSNDKIISKLQNIYEDTPDIMTKLIILKKLTREKKVTLSCDDTDYLNSVENSDIKRKFIEISEFLPCSIKYLEKYINNSDPYVSIDASAKLIEITRKK